jgi:hypothetical protein
LGRAREFRFSLQIVRKGFLSDKHLASYAGDGRRNLRRPFDLKSYVKLERVAKNNPKFTMGSLFSLKRL